MAIFQKSVLNRYLLTLDEDIINKAYKEYNEFFGEKERIENIKALKEENYQEGFLREIFVDVLGYTINPNKNFNLTTEYKNESDNKKADGAIILDGEAVAVIELKSTKTTDMKSIETQAFNYKRNHKNCRYVITSNFDKLYFYIDDYSVDYEEFNLFNMDLANFKRFYLTLSKDSIFGNLPVKIKEDSKVREIEITKLLYSDYHSFKRKIFNNMAENNPGIEKLVLLKKSQKLLDRLLFIFFAEDRMILPDNMISKISDEFREMKEKDEYKPLYYFFKKYFKYIDEGIQRKDFTIYGFNGELFKTDESLDSLIIDDEILYDDAVKISSYDFQTDIDVDILGHIFENSLNDIEELHAEINGIVFDKTKTKRKKEGVFYTPKYITKYIVDNTLGVLCEEKKKELNLVNIEFDTTKDYKRLTKDKKDLLERILQYREYLLSLKILDPACGSGAFLIQALDCLINEHQFIEEYRKSLEGDLLGLYEIEKSILEHNIYGVDINEEAVEIAKLSLWLRTAEKGRKLNDLSSHIKCGNSLIDDKEIAGDKAFKWEEEFPEIMKDGGFDVVIGNPPYVFAREKITENEKEYYIKKYESSNYQVNTFALFIEKSIKLLKDKKYLGLIIPNSLLKISSMFKLREFILKTGYLKNIIQLFGYSFENVNVETIIINFQKGIYNKNVNVLNIIKESDINNKYDVIDSSSWIKDKEFRFQISMDDKAEKIIERIKNSTFKLEKSFEVKAGLKAYEASKGNPKQTPEDVKQRPYDYTYKYDESTYKYLEGKDVGKYFIYWGGSWLKYGEILAAPRTFDIFERPRILIREITGKFPKNLICTFTEELFLNNLSIINVLSYKNNKEELKLLLLILSSTLISYYFSKTTPKSDRQMFPKIILQDLREFPIKFPDQQQPFIKKADLMLSLNKTFQEKKEKFISRVKSNFNLEKITGKLEDFYLYDFKDFIDELAKQKIKLTLKDQDEWEDYFKEYKTELLNIKNEIDKTDREIDGMVYQLYGLTEEEIGIVEGE